MMVGYVLIELRGLVLLDHSAKAFALRAVAAWFACTGAVAWGLARAQRFEQHRAWAFRHLASGLWVALQRVMLAVFSVASHVAGWTFEAPGSREHVFESAAALAVVLCLGTCELYLWADARRRRTASAVKRE